MRSTGTATLAAALSLAASLAFAGESSPAPAGASELVNRNTLCRFFITTRRPVVSVASFKAANKPADAPKAIPVKVSYRSYPGINNIDNAPPKKDWTGADFDDADWPRAPLASRHLSGVLGLDRIPYHPGVLLTNFRISVRARFMVTNPAAVKDLFVSLKYRGGVLVYLNGKEVLRKHMPKGDIQNDTPAELYPESAWTYAGKVIPREREVRRSKKMSADEKTKIRAAVAARTRVLNAIKIPTKALRRGVNVLAVEVRRSDYHPVALNSRKWGTWPPIYLGGLRLHAAGGGAVPNTSAPQGFRVWNHDLNNRVTVEDHADPFDKLSPMKLYGARNGTFTGVIVAGSDSPLNGLSVKASDLASKDGKIEAKNVSVRYGVPDLKSRHNPGWFDGISAKPATGVKVQPVLISVTVPADAKPGLYGGKVTVSAAGAKSVQVPVSLTVSNWALPAPKDFRCYIGIYQSPTSVALKYKVPLWSEKHWELVAKSYEVLSRVGNKLVNVHLVDQTQFGNDESYVTYIKKEDGSYGYDFKVFDRLMDLAAKHWTKPEFVALQGWHSAGWAARKADQKNTITVLDKKTGKKTRVQLPKFDSDDARKFWKPLLAAVHERLKQRGWGDTMCIGILSDGTAPGPVFSMFDAVWPGGGPAKWTRGCHVHTNAPKPYKASKGGGAVVLHEHCYGMGMADPAKGLPKLHEFRQRPAAAYIRHNWDHNLSLLKYHNMAERGMYCGKRGIGRICFDFWNVHKDSRGRSANLYNRYPHSSCAQRAPTLFQIGYAGPDGPGATIRFENFREGVQEVEALIYLSEAADKHAARIGPKLTERFNKLLRARLDYAKLRASETYGKIVHRTNYSGWSDLSRELYELTDEVQKKLGGK